MSMFLYCKTTADDSIHQSDKCSAIIQPYSRNY